MPSTRSPPSRSRQIGQGTDPCGARHPADAAARSPSRERGRTDHPSQLCADLRRGESPASRTASRSAYSMCEPNGGDLGRPRWTRASARRGAGTGNPAKLRDVQRCAESPPMSRYRRGCGKPPLSSDARRAQCRMSARRRGRRGGRAVSHQRHRGELMGCDRPATRACSPASTSSVSNATGWSSGEKASTRSASASARPGAGPSGLRTGVCLCWDATLNG